METSNAIEIPARANNTHDEAYDEEPNWWEFRFKNQIPERRGYHSSFIHNNK